MGTYIEKLANQHHVTKVDATEPLVVEVTERDIRLAKQKNAKQCALARAVKRSIPGARSAHGRQILDPNVVRVEVIAMFTKAADLVSELRMGRRVRKAMQMGIGGAR